MPHYQTLLFGCPNPLKGPDDRDDLELIESTWDWIAEIAEQHIILDWPADTVLIAQLPSEQTEGDGVLGVAIACSHSAARRYPRPVAPLFELLPRDAGAQTLAELCLPLAEDIQRAALRWEIARFAARAVGLDLPPGRLYLVEGWYDDQ